MKGFSAKEAHHLHNVLVYTIKVSKENFITLGQVLYELKKDNVFQLAIGEGIDRWHDYIAQPEIGLSKGEANRLAQIYEQFVEKLGYNTEEVSQIPIKALHRLLPVVKSNELNKTQVEELVGDAKVLNQKDFRERVFDVKAEDTGQARTYEYIIMKKCIQTSNMEKVHDINSRDIKEFIENYVKQT